MFRRLIAAVFVLPGPAALAQDAAVASEFDRPDATPLDTAAHELCVRNLDGHTHFFAVETTAADRRTATLAPGDRLCITAKDNKTGMVQVFESADAFEGCSRLVPVGRTEDMLKYVDFDRCFWGSNT
jgi:hypothetical protein